MRALGDPPLAEAGLSVEAREQARIRFDGDGLRFARLELDSLESEQAHAAAIRRVTEIQLGNVRARDLASVCDCERCRHGVTAFELQILVGERR